MRKILTVAAALVIMSPLAACAHDPRHHRVARHGSVAPYIAAGVVAGAAVGYAYAHPRYPNCWREVVGHDLFDRPIIRTFCD